MGTEDLQNKAAEVMKKVLTVGVGAFFLTEESLRSLVSEFKLPKELLSAVLDTAHKTKGEFLKNFSNELLAHVMERIDTKALLQEILSENDIEFHVKLNVKPKKNP